MAITSTKFDRAVSYKVLHDANMTNAAQKNVTDGPGKLHSVKIVNGNNAAVYVKLFNNYSASVGTTAPDWVLSCPASSTYTYEIPDGISYDALTVCATENGTPSDNTAPSVSGNETIAVTIVTSV
jgi:hypothetical protein|tara:strand:+ start:757 stop:1131 length:375 start_codon:yes stop_codon:yes gene_type:complete